MSCAESRDSGDAVLERAMRRGTGVTSSLCAERGRRRSGVQPEHSAEVALVAEARARTDLRDRPAALRQLARRALDPKPADVRADGLAMARPERTGEMCGMHADRRRDG